MKTTWDFISRNLRHSLSGGAGALLISLEPKATSYAIAGVTYALSLGFSYLSDYLKKED